MFHLFVIIITIVFNNVLYENRININMEEEIIINVDYNIEIMDMFKGRNVIKIYIGK